MHGLKWPINSTRIVPFELGADQDQPELVHRHEERHVVQLPLRLLGGDPAKLSSHPRSQAPAPLKTLAFIRAQK